jgi:hypothetical protein
MHMLIQPTLESLQEKYAKHLKDEAIQDFIPVSYKFKNCNLVLTETRLICIQDDINGLKPHFTLQKQSIEQITYSSYSITIKYPRSAPLKVSFTGLNPHKNQTFAKNLPKSQLHKANKTEVSIVLGGGAALILLLVVGAITNPRSYADKSPSTISSASSDTFSQSQIMSDCQSAVSAQLKSPSRAEFESMLWAKDKVTKNGSRYYWRSYVDAPNAFNAVIRDGFNCIHDGQTATVFFDSALTQ